MRCYNYSVSIYNFDTQFLLMDSPLILIYYDMSVILTMAHIFFKNYSLILKFLKMFFLEKKSVSIIVRSSLNEGFEQVNKKNISNYLLKLSSLRTFHQITSFKQKFLYVIFIFSNSEIMANK